MVAPIRGHLLWIAQGSLSDVVGLVAGLAGVNNSESQARGERFVTVDGLACDRVVVNDAVVAHAGALRSRPGIIAIGGTGSVAFGVNEAGEHVRNYDARPWTGVSAANFAYDAVHRLMVGDAMQVDEEFARQVYAFWDVADLAGLRELGAAGFIEDRTDRDYRFGAMANLVTDAADRGSPLARSVCDVGVAAICVGIRIVALRFAHPAIDVVLIGGVIRSRYVAQAISKTLAEIGDRQFAVVEPAFAPEIGAAMIALENHGIAIDEEVAAHLSQIT